MLSTTTFCSKIIVGTDGGDALLILLALALLIVVCLCSTWVKPYWSYRCWQKRSRVRSRREGETERASCCRRLRREGETERASCCKRQKPQDLDESRKEGEVRQSKGLFSGEKKASSSQPNSLRVLDVWFWKRKEIKKFCDVLSASLSSSDRFLLVYIDSNVHLSVLKAWRAPFRPSFSRGKWPTVLYPWDLSTRSWNVRFLFFFFFFGHEWGTAFAVVELSGSPSSRWLQVRALSGERCYLKPPTANLPIET